MHACAGHHFSPRPVRSARIRRGPVPLTLWQAWARSLIDASSAIVRPQSREDTPETNTPRLPARGLSHPKIQGLQCANAAHRAANAAKPVRVPRTDASWPVPRDCDHELDNPTLAKADGDFAARRLPPT